MAGDGVPRVTKLDVDNYLSWSTEMENVMRYKRCWSAVKPVDGGATSSTSGETAAAAATPLPMDEAMLDKEEMARSLIMLNVKQHHHAALHACRTARDRWETLAAEFRSQGPAREMNLRMELDQTRMKANESVVHYFNRSKMIVWELGVLGVQVADRQHLTTLLHGLAPKFRLRGTIIASQRGMTVAMALEELRAAESEMRLETGGRRDTSGAALAAAEEGGRHGAQERLCYKCNKPGHIKRNCPEWGKAKKGQHDGRAVSMLAVATSAGGSKEVSRGTTTVALATPQALRADGDQGAGGGVRHWIVDSGASHHMTGEDTALTNLGPRAPVCVELADGGERVATKMGNAVIDGMADGEPVALTLNDVLVVPGLAVSLFSVRVVTKLGYRVTFDDERVRIYGRDQLILDGRRHGSVYVLSEEGVEGGLAATATSAQTWHQRFAHAGGGTLALVPAAVTGMDVTAKELRNLGTVTCGPCVRGKMTRAPFPTSRTTVEGALDLIHTDVCGPMPVATPSGHRFQVVVIDDKTKYKAVVPVKTKGQASDVVMDVINRWETQLSRKAKVVRMDGGKEYESRGFDTWRSSKGIVIQTTTRYTPEQNGVAERYNRTLGERVTAVLADSNLPRMWWGEAGLAVAYVGNRTPSRGETATPYELFFGKKPDVRHLRSFGCRVWAHVPRQVRRKMGDKAKMGTFMGYSEDTKGYKVLLGGRVILTRDVRFEEGLRGPDALGRPVGEAKGAPKKPTASKDPDAGLVGADVGSDDDEGVAPRLVTQSGAGASARPSVGVADPSTVADAVAAARELFGHPRTQCNADGVDGDGGGAPEEEPPVAGQQTGDPPSRSTVRSLRARPKQTARADANSGVGGAYAAIAPSLDKMLIHKARREPDWELFDAAVEKEVESLWSNGTWELVDLPEGKKVTGTQMLCERKRGPDGKVSRYKGRFVARGDTQVYMVDYCEVWAPVARHATLRAVLAACAAKGWTLCQLDVETAFLNGEVAEEVYVRQPVGYERGDKGKVCRLLKALYGLKQASRAWYKKLTQALRAAGMKPADADPCLFSGLFDCVIVYVLVYVDDLLVFGATDAAVEACKAGLTDAFTVRDMGEPTYFLGMHVTRDYKAGTISLGQRQYVKTILERFGLTDCNPVRLPMGAGVTMRREGTSLNETMATKYQEAVGALLYLSTCTRPDVSFAVGKLSRHVSAPTQAHWSAAKAVMRYLKGTFDWRLTYGGGGPLVGYSDADYAGDVDTRRSTTGQVFLWGGAAISWASKIQATVATSTTEAEYVAAATAAREALWLRRLVRELGGQDGAVLMHCDSQGAMAMMHNPVSSNRTKHIDVAHHFVRECVESGAIKVIGVRTGEMVADYLTKPLPRDAFNKCRAAVGLVEGEADAARVGVLARGPDDAPAPPDRGGTPVEGAALDAAVPTSAPSGVGL